MPSRIALSRYGNTSSSSIWYEMDFIAAEQGDLKRGQRILQVGLGSTGYLRCSNRTSVLRNN